LSRVLKTGNLNLIIEQGNTAIKVAVYDRGEMINSSVYDKYDAFELLSWMDRYPLENGIFSTVVAVDQTLIACLNGRLKHFLFLDEQTKLPVTIRYRTPNTLGKDRIAAAVGANFLHPEENVLVIDAGTAITYDVVEASGVYIGGNISPGMTTRFRALNRFTEKLPLVQEKEDIPFLGSSTETAIQAGVVNGIVYEMDSYINELQIKYPGLFVFLTGGHSFYFERRLKNSIFAAINLVLIGLNRILEYNVENK
jgi:type III pantothenate kinase